MTAPVIRLLRPADVPACLVLSGEAGWNQTSEDWLELLKEAPDGCFAIDSDGGLAATTTAVCYGSTLAWIGMVLTMAIYRRRGFASALMDHTLQFLERKQVAWIKLDATDLGRPVYQRFGFEDECAVERWLRPGTRAVAFAPQSRVLSGGFARGRPGSVAAYFGPCEASSPEVARELLEWFLALHPEEAIYWDLLPGNRNAVSLAEGHGFAPARKLTRMARRGRPGAPKIPARTRQTYAIRGFEWG